MGDYLEISITGALADNCSLAQLGVQVVTRRRLKPPVVTVALERKSFQISHVCGRASDFTHFLKRLSVSCRGNEVTA